MKCSVQSKMHTHYPCLVVKTKRIAIIDTETTGLLIRDHVIQLAIVIADVDNVDGTITICESWNTLVRPSGFHIDYSIYHHVTHDDANTNGIPIALVLNHVSEMMCKWNVKTLHAYNAAFDKRMVEEEAKRIGMPFKYEWECVLKIVRKQLPMLPSKKLQLVYTHLFPDNLQVKWHDALEDVLATAQVFGKLTCKN